MDPLGEASPTADGYHNSYNSQAPSEGRLTCRQGDVAIEAALVNTAAGVVAVHNWRHGALALLAALPQATVALCAIGLIGTLVACGG